MRGWNHSISKSALRADGVLALRGLLQRACACGQHTNGGECDSCRNKREGGLPHAAVNSSPVEVPPLVHEVLHSPSQPLDTQTRAFMEPRFGHDFSSVRVHTDAKAAESARAVDAQAYTVGRHVVFGAGQYAPEAVPGRRLLAHELTHVVQQYSSPATASLRIDTAGEQEANLATDSILSSGSDAGVSVSQTREPTLARQVDDERPSVERSMELRTLHALDASAEPEDPERNLGTRLWNQFPNGVNVAFYADPEPPEAKRRADGWAKRENAVGPRGSKISPETIEFGRAISDTLGLAPTLTKLSAILRSAVAKGKPAVAPMPAPSTGPAQIRNLAIFSHGTYNWCGLGSGITRSNAASTVKSIASTLATDVNVLLFACNTGRGSTETEDWVKGTMEGGGEDSVAAAARDALITEKLTSGTVWGHTTTGHVSENPALREFSAASGKGTAGVSYVSTFIFTAADKTEALSQLQEAIDAAGYDPKDPKKLSTAAAMEVTAQMYRCYMEANAKLKFQGGNLAETAPTHPKEVASVVKDYWKQFWATQRLVSAERIAKQLQLKKVAASSK